MIHDLAVAPAIQEPLENIPNDLCCRVHHKLVLILGGFVIPIRRQGTHKFPRTSQRFQAAVDLLGNITGIQLIDQVRCGNGDSFLIRLRITGIIVIVDRDKADSQKGKDLFQIVPSLPEVPGKAGEVLDDDAVDLPGTHILHHPLKIRPVKLGSGLSVIGVDLHKTDIRMCF